MLPRERGRPHREPDLFGGPELPRPADCMGGGPGEPGPSADVACARPVSDAPQAYVSWSELDRRIKAIYAAYGDRK